MFDRFGAFFCLEAKYMTQIDVEFDLKEKVRVKTLGVEGFVNSYFIQANGAVQYQLEWLDGNGQINHTYFGENDLERVK